MKKTTCTHPAYGVEQLGLLRAGVTEKALRENARFMAAHLLPYGWNTLVCDIQWYEPQAKGNEYNNFASVCMDEYGRLLPAENRFPSAAGGKGFGPIADYCHSLGLRFGIHIMRGIPRQAVHRDTPILGTDLLPGTQPITSPSAPGTRICTVCGIMLPPKRTMTPFVGCTPTGAWILLSATIFASRNFASGTIRITPGMRLKCSTAACKIAGGRWCCPCLPGPADIANLPHLRRHAQMWRMTGDFWDRWDKLHDMFDRCKTWEGVPGPGCWPDCDMLPVGRLCKDAPYHGEQNRMSNFTPDEVRTMFTLWGIFRSPLFLGGDLPEMPRRCAGYADQ